MNSQDSTKQEKEIMKMHSEDLNTRAMAGSEDCLNLAVFTPRVNIYGQGSLQTPFCKTPFGNGALPNREVQK